MKKIMSIILTAFWLVGFCLPAVSAQYKTVAGFERIYGGRHHLKITSSTGWKTSPINRKIKVMYRSYLINGNVRAAAFMRTKIRGLNLKIVITRSSLQGAKRAMNAQVRNIKTN